MPLLVLEARLIHPRGKPVGVWETKTTKTARKNRIWGLKIAKNGPNRAEKAVLDRKWTQIDSNGA